MSEQNFNSLLDFNEKARKNRKYPDNTASGLRAALKLFESELNEEERESLDTFEKNLERINQSVCNKNDHGFSASTLVSYRSRVQRVLNDYKKYGNEVAKFNSWNPPIRKMSKRSTSTSSSKNVIEDKQPQQVLESHNAVDSFRLEIPLGDNKKALIVLPKNITSSEVTLIKNLLDNIIPTEPK